MTQVVDSDNSLIAAWQRGSQRAINARPHTPWRDALREAAKAAFEKLGFPATRDEAWRFTNIAPLTRIPFQPAAFPPECLSPRMIDQAYPELSDLHQLVFVNGHFNESLSRLGSFPAGAVLSHLSAASVDESDWIEQKLGQLADFRQHAFTALNTACFEDAAILLLPPGAMIEQPIHLLFVSTAGAEPSVSHPRVLIVAEAGSQATVLESYLDLTSFKRGQNPGFSKKAGFSKAGFSKAEFSKAEFSGAASCFTNAVTEIAVGENAGVNFCRLQGESEEDFHVGLTEVHLDAGASLNSCVVSTGGKLARHELNVVFDGEGGDCWLNGLAVARGRQLLDHQTHIDHVSPRCTSREFYKAIVEDEAHGVFSGKIHVHSDAQKTDARQTNHTLLLSDNAVMDTQPQLEIYADDVKCTHGASVGSLDDQALFYLRSRGIGCDDARQLLTLAFMNEVLGHVPVDAVRSHLEQHLVGIMRFESDPA